MKLYLISGLGANQKAFERLNFPKGIEPVFIEWKQPEPNETLEHYALRMTDEINPNETFALAGLSFGGIVTQEMNKFIQPEKTILISTVKNRQEIPKIMKLCANTKAHKIIPMSFFTNDSVVSYAFFRKLYNPNMPKFNEYFTHRDPYYLKWAIDKIVNWDNSNPSKKNDYHLHGDKDIVFPIKNISNVTQIKNGTHLMVLQQPKKVNQEIQQIFEGS